MKKELYKKHRPKKLSSIIGQNAAVKMLEGMIKNNRIPHFLLFSGPSGCGKTTLARIIKKELKCSKTDFTETNGADVRGIDNTRKIRNQMQALPLRGKYRIWLIDEAHKLTNEAITAFLKMLEDTPKHVYFMMATTHPEKLLPTIRTRATEVVVTPLKDKELDKLIQRVCKKESLTVPSPVIEKIIFHSFGAARKALVLLDQVMNLEEERDMLSVITKTTGEEASNQVARALMNSGTPWKKMAGILKECIKEDAETIRWGVIMYARAVLLSTTGGMKVNGRAFLIIDAFQDNFFNSKHAGLAAACYEVIVGGSG